MMLVAGTKYLNTMDGQVLELACQKYYREGHEDGRVEGREEGREEERIVTEREKRR